MDAVRVFYNGRVSCHTHLIFFTNLPISRSLSNIYEKYRAECENRAAQITQLIGVKEGTVLLPGFDDEEVDGLLDMLCCD